MTDDRETLRREVAELFDMMAGPSSEIADAAITVVLRRMAKVIEELDVPYDEHAECHEVAAYSRAEEDAARAILAYAAEQREG